MAINLKGLPAAALMSTLAACASVPDDWGRAQVQQITAEHGRPLPHVDDVQGFTSDALLKSLDVDTAVQIALLNNPTLRRETAGLGFEAAEVYEAGRLANPVFSLRQLSGDSSSRGGNMPSVTLGIALNFVNLLFLPANHRFAEAKFEAAKLGVAATALDLAADVEVAWYEAIGADQVAQMREAAADAGRASAELAQRFFAAGNISPRELAMERAAGSTATLAALAARAAAVAARSRLNRLMGLSADQNTWAPDARLAEPLDQEDDTAKLLQLGLDSRLDVASLRRHAQALADRYGFTRSTRWVGEIQIGAEGERDFDGAVDVGPTLSLELPLFNWGSARMASMRAVLEQAEADLDARVLDMSNQVQAGSARVHATKSLALEYSHALIPLREAIVARAQEEQNYMLIGVFELIVTKQQEYEAYAGYIEAVRDYWVARAELARAVGRSLPSSAQEMRPRIDPMQVLVPTAPMVDHHQHSSHGSPVATETTTPRPARHGDHR